MKIKNVLLMGLSLVLVAVIAIGGTVAYLTTPEQEKSNIFTIGNIDIELREETAVLGEGGEVKSTENGAEYTGVMPGDYLKKEVTVENTGKTPAYVAVTVTLNNAAAINAAIDDVYGDGTEGGQAMYDFIFDGWGINQDPRPGKNGDDARGVIDGIYGLPEHVMQVDFTKTITDYWLYGTGNWFHGVDEKANQYWVDSVSVDNFGGGYYAKNMDPDQICYTYYLYLSAGESSTLFKGLNVPAEFNAEQLAMFDGLEINVLASAIQADNMAVADEYKNDPDGKAKTAFAILAGEIETPEYSNKPSGTVTPAYASMVGNATWNSIWGEAYTNAKNSLEIKVYSGDTYLGTNSLNDLSKSNIVTWHCYFNGDDFEEWTMTWAQKPTIDLLPTTVELWVDGEKVDETAVRMDSPDNLATITGAVLNANGEIVKFVTKNWTGELVDGETYVPFVSNNDELKNALADGAYLYLSEGEYTLPSLANYTGVTIIGADGAVIGGENATTGFGSNFGNNTTIKNVTFSGNTNGVRYSYAKGGTTTFENCTFAGDSTYGFHIDQSNGATFIFNNCTFSGFNAFAGDLEKVEFNNCTFLSNGSYGHTNIWSEGYFNNCTWGEGATYGTAGNGIIYIDGVTVD